MKRFLTLPLVALIMFGCATGPAPNSEFVGSVNFSALDTFSYKHTLITGMDFRKADEILIRQMSDDIISRELVNRGFERVEEEADFYAVAKWKKAVSSYPSPFQPIDGVYDSMNRRNNPSNKFASRMHLTLEIYESETNRMFWRKDLPNIFDSIQLTADRLDMSLTRAIENFPEAIEKDPNLPSLE